MFCEACGNRYCTTCNLVRHRVGKRKDHTFIRISSVNNARDTHAHAQAKELEDSQPDQKGTAVWLLCLVLVLYLCKHI